MKYDKVVQQFRDERSMEMYGKNEIELTIAERQRLDEYIKDYNNPVWKDIIIDNINTGYKVSNIGQIKNPKTNHILKPTLTEFGYGKVCLTFNDVMKTMKVHRLVAIAFIPNLENKREVNHKNCNKTFNWVGNLEWVTSAENKQHAYEHGLYDNIQKGQEKYNVKFTDEQIHRVCKLLEEGKHVKEVSKIVGVPESCPRSIKYNGRWKHIASQYKIPKVGDIPRHDPNTPSAAAKLTEDQVHKVCKMIQDGKYAINISKELNIHPSIITNIRLGRSWNYIAKDYKFPDIRNKFNPIVFHKDEIEKYLENGETDYGKILKDINIPDDRKSRKYIATLKFKINNKMKK